MRLIDADELVLEFIAYFCGDRTEIPPTAQLAVKMLIDAAPTIDPASLRPKGEWIERPDERICPFCNYRYNYFGGKNKNFCPNCAADMRGNPNDS